MPRARTFTIAADGVVGANVPNVRGDGGQSNIRPVADVAAIARAAPSPDSDMLLVMPARLTGEILHCQHIRRAAARLLSREHWPGYHRRMVEADAPWHAHIYYEPADRPAAEALRGRFAGMMAGDDVPILYVGRMADRPVGPHPIPQFEIHFPASAGADVARTIETSGLRALIHPLTDDDLADHTTLAQWVGEPLDLDVSVLDPPGENRGVARFGKSDF